MKTLIHISSYLFLGGLVLLFGGPIGVVLVIIVGVLMVVGSVSKHKEVKAMKGKEAKCTCSTCGHVWCYGQQEVKQGHTYKYLNKCPGCGSVRIRKDFEIVE